MVGSLALASGLPVASGLLMVHETMLVDPPTVVDTPTDALPARLRVDVHEDEWPEVSPWGRFLLAVLWPVRFGWAVIRRGLHSLWRLGGDCVHAARYHTADLIALLNRWLLRPLRALLTEPLNVMTRLLGVVVFLPLTFWRLTVALFREFFEQLVDVVRLIRMLVVQALVALGLGPADPSPIHAVPLRQPGSSGDGDNDTPLQELYAHAEPPEVAPENSPLVAEVERPSLPPAARTVPLAVPAREEVEIDRPVVAAAELPRSRYRCPECRSEEVYATRGDGTFTASLRERAWLMQHMFCERCLHEFRRPGRLLAAPAPLIRPLDSELYDT